MTPLRAKGRFPRYYAGAPVAYVDGTTFEGWHVIDGAKPHDKTRIWGQRLHKTPMNEETARALAAALNDGHIKPADIKAADAN